MASDSEGLRHYRDFFYFFWSLLKMASDSEGLRLWKKGDIDDFTLVENGFRFGRVTTKTRYPLPITCYVLSEGSNLLIYR